MTHDNDLLIEFKSDIKDELRSLQGFTAHQYEKLDDKLDQLNASMTRTETREQQQDKQIEGLEHAIYGNGRPGLKADVQHTNAQLSRLDSDIKELKTTVTGGFKALKDREEALATTERAARVKIIIAVIGALGVGGAFTKLLEALMGI